MAENQHQLGKMEKVESEPDDIDRLFRRLVLLRLQRDRAKEARRSREHAAQRLTWVASQQSQPTEGPVTRFHHEHERTEEDEVEEVAVEMAKLVRPMTAELLNKVVETRIMNDDFVVFMRALFDASTAKHSGGVQRMIWAYELVIDCLLTAGSDVARLDDLVAELLARTNALPDAILAFLVEKILACCLKGGAGIKRDAMNGSLEVLCKLVFRVHAFPRGALDPDSRCRQDLQGMDGEAYYVHVVETICRAQWQPESVLPLLSAVRELCSKSAQARLTEALALVETKTRKCLAQCDEKDLPELTAQLLLLSGLYSDRRLTIEAMIEHFETMENDSLAPPVIGQVLSRLTIAVSQDAQIGTSLLKLIEKRRNWSISALCVMLALGKVKRFEKIVVETVRKRALDRADALVRTRTSPWLSKMELSGDALVSADRLYENLCSVCDSARCGGWDLIVPILVRVATRLADEHDVFSPNCDPYFDVELESAALKHQHQMAAGVTVGCMGVKLLARLFSGFTLTQTDLLAEVINRALILSTSDKGALPMIRFLNLVVKATPQSVFEDHSSVVKDLITLLPSVAPRVAHGLLRALQPGLDPRSPFRDVRDHAMVVFRKGLFQRDLNPRLVSLFGVLSCCRSVGEDGDDGYDHGDLEENQRDAFGCLRRCLTQQYEMKSALYPALRLFPRAFRADLLLGHLQSGLVDSSGDADLSPLRFDLAIDSATGAVKEPLALLVRTACFMSNGSRNQGDGKESAIWDPSQVIDRMAVATMPVFSLDKNSPFDTDTVKGCTNRSTGNQVIEACEVLMDVLISRLLLQRQQQGGEGEASSSSSSKKRRMATPGKASSSGLTATTPATMAATPTRFSQLMETIDVSSSTGEDSLGKLASLWRVQRAVRRLIQLALDKQREAATQAQAAEKKLGKKKKKAGGKQESNSDVEDDDDEDVQRGPGGGSGKRLKRSGAESAEDIRSKKEAAERFSLPVEGEYLSNDALVVMIQLGADKCSLSAMLDAASGSSSSSAAPKRDDIASVLSNLGFHSYLMSAIRARVLLQSRSLPPSASSSSATTMTLLETYARMAESCSGGVPCDPVDFLLPIARSLIKLYKRYASLASMLAKESSSKSEQNDKDGKRSASKKKKPMTVEPCSAGAKSLVELSALRDLTLDAVKEVFALAASSLPPPCLVQIAQTAFALSKEEIELSAVLSSSATRAYEILLDCLVEKRFQAASSALSLLSSLLLAVPPSSPSAVAGFQEHVNGMRQVLLGYQAGRHPQVVRQTVKLYLDLSLRMDKDSLGPAFADVAQGLAREFTRVDGAADEEEDDREKDGDDETDHRMLRGEQASHAGIGVLLQMLSVPVLDECERVIQTLPEVFSNELRQSELVARLGAVGQVLAVLLQQGLPRGAVTEQVLRCLVRLYKSIIKLFRGLATKKTAAAPGALGKLVQFLWKTLTPLIDARVVSIVNAKTTTTTAAGPSSKENKSKRKSKGETMRDAKVIPEMVFNIEQYESVLLKASKICPEIQHLTKYVRRMTARDFKLDVNKVVSTLQEQEEEENHRNQEGEEDDDE